MKELSDKELTQNVKNGCEDSLKELVNRHSGIYVKVVNSCGAMSLDPFEFQDLMSDKDLEIYNAAKKYDPSKSKFSTYVGLRARYRCLTKREEKGKRSHLCPFDGKEVFIKSDEKDPLQNCSHNESSENIRNEIELIDNDTTRKIFEMRYYQCEGNKLTPWREISEATGLTIQGCIYNHDRELKKLKKKINDKIVTF